MGQEGTWESSGIVEGKEGETAGANRRLGGQGGRSGGGCRRQRLRRARRDRGTECGSGLSSEATLFAQQQVLWLEGLGPTVSARVRKVSGSGRCGGLVKFLKRDEPIRNDNVMSF